MAHEKHVDKLFRRMSIDPPAQFVTPTLSEVLRADLEVFLYLSKNVLDIRPLPGAAKPLDAALDDALKDYDNAVFHLLPMLKASSHVSENRYGPDGNSTSLRDENSKSKGKGKNKKGFGSGLAPRGLVGCVGRDPKGRNLFFDYNLSSCSKAPDGATCPKGRDVCFKAGCHKVHAAEMPKKDGSRTE